MNSDFLAGLNPAQLAAVTTRSHALVLAGAGSGKTRVLTSRIAWLLREGLASPASVLAVTFTNKAAREMQTRVGAMLPVNPRMMWIGTFHGLAHRLLRLHHRDAGLPATFTILDSQDQLAAIKRLLKALNLSDDEPMAYITQTTLSVDDTRDIIAALEARLARLEEILMERETGESAAPAAQ